MSTSEINLAVSSHVMKNPKWRYIHDRSIKRTTSEISSSEPLEAMYIREKTQKDGCLFSLTTGYLEARLLLCPWNFNNLVGG